MSLLYDTMTVEFLQRQKIEVWKLYATLPWSLVQQWCKDMSHPAAIVADLKRLKHFVDEHGIEEASALGAEMQATAPPPATMPPPNAPEPGPQPAGIGWTLEGEPFARDWNDPVTTAWCDAWKDWKQLPYVAELEPERAAIVHGAETGLGGFWCARCQSGIVKAPGLVCLACREGWTPEQYRAG